MLVLTRKSEEQIVIGKNKEITITVLKIQDGKVSLGLKAPKDTPIYRRELLLREEEKNSSSEACYDLTLDDDSDHDLANEESVLSEVER